MKSFLTKYLLLIHCLTATTVIFAQTGPDKDNRMQWWREARFGMFIHWGLYSIPAGEWKGQTDHAEWIRTTAQIPLDEYVKFAGQFNPVEFDAEEWVKIARDAGMKYIVLTSKHHDGFCLFDSKFTEFDIMSTPFKRDILKELADACRKYDMKIGWYHSIMDWHHPDYLPRREWETGRPADSADFNRFFGYLKNQVQEIITNYGDISVLWFDGEWESTWNHDYANELYGFIRNLDVDILINNRIDVYRDGMGGLNTNAGALGDFGTPEQEIPEAELTGVDWESCMTMNDHWGYNKHDNNWKSEKELIFNLVEIASKGGNCLLNVGPTAEGLIPEPSVKRLRVIGDWMKENGGSIYGTGAGPFKKPVFGKCTQKPTDEGTRLFLHIFDWPRSEKLVLPGLVSEPVKAFLLADAGQTPLPFFRKAGSLEITLPANAPDSLNTVVVLDIKGSPKVLENPEFAFRYDPGTDKVEVKLVSDASDPKVSIYYTLDGTVPSDKSSLYTKPVMARLPLELKAMLYYNNRKAGEVITAKLPISFGKPVTLRNEPGEKYRASGPSSLTDGQMGSMKFTDGRWIGIEGKDFEAVLDLGKKTSVRSAYLSYLVKVKSWIFEPVELRIDYSNDDKEYKPLLSKKINPAMWKTADAIRRYSDVFPEVNARYIRFTAKNRGTCPEGHPGAGGKAWVFVDEIGVE